MMTEFEELLNTVEIKILYRDRIKVFFKTVKEAIDAGYTDFDMAERTRMQK